MIKQVCILSITLLFLSSNLKAEEKIRFNLKFGFIKGGEATMVISDTIFESKPAVHYYLAGRTTGLTDKLFEVNDVYESIVDPETMLPYKSIRNIKEGKYRYYNEVLYYHEADSIYSQRSGGRKVEPNLVDILTAFFYFRSSNFYENIKIGDVATMPSLHADKISDITIVYSGEETIRTKKGKMECYILSPVVDKGKVLMKSDGLKFYVSKEYNIPVLMEFDMKVGALKAVLKSYRVDGKKKLD